MQSLCGMSTWRAPKSSADHVRPHASCPMDSGSYRRGSALVIYFNALMKKSKPNHSGHLVPTVCVYAQYMLYFSQAQRGRKKPPNPLSLFEEGRSA